MNEEKLVSLVNRKITAFLVLLLAVALACIAFFLIDTDPRAKMGDRQNYTSGEYLAFAVPWAAETGIMRQWSNHADTVRIDVESFPDNTRIDFAWPPFTPRGGVAGVWGYFGIGHGNYDGGSAEKPVTPRRVDDIQTLSQSFAWTGRFTFGVADVLTEFYLRSDPADAESKLIEIGWMLHVPERSKKYLAEDKIIGKYADPDGKVWNVHKNEDFVTFTSEDYSDVLKGRIDMLAALHWLKENKVITGREWYTGVAIGVEPFKGTGKMQIDHWAVDYK